MELKICLFVIVVFVVLQRCYTDTIDVEFPSVAPQNFEYILDIDPVNREYNCIDVNNNNNNNTDIYWRDIPLMRHTNPLNVYSVYTNTKTIGIKKFTCYNQNTYLGTTDIEVKEGGHIEVILDNIPINYTTNQVLEVVENTNNLVITCSADTGELISGGVAQSYPSVIIPTVTSQHDNNVYTCRRIIGGEILFEVSLTLMVPVSSTTQGVTTIPSVTSSTSGTIQSSSSTMVDTTEPTSTIITTTEATATQMTTTTSPTTTIITTPETTTTTTATSPTTITITDPTTTAGTTTPEITSPTTTTTPSLPSVSIHLSYTPNYNTVFVGYDDVTITCSITTDSIADNLTIMLIDVSTGSILKSQIGNQASILLELVKGNITHKCSVQTDRGLFLGGQTADLRVEDMYTQEVLNLHTIIPSNRGVRLVWETSYPQLANEIYIISVYSVNESIQHKDITTNMTEYYLIDVSYTFHYYITVDITNRLHNTNNSYTQIYYIHNQLISKPSTLYGIIGLIAGVLILIVLVIIVVLLIIILVLKRKKTNKHEYTKQDNSSSKPENITPNKEYIQLSDIHTLPSRHQTNYKYEPMTSVVPIRDEYVEVSTQPDYYEIPDSHFTEHEYENLASVICK